MKPAVACLLLVGLSLAFADDEDAIVQVDEGEEATVKIVDDTSYETPNLGPEASGSVYLAEHFDDLDAFKKRWVKSEAKKEGIDEDIAKYDGAWEVEPAERDPLRGDLGLVLKSKAKHSAIAAKLDRPFVFKDKPFVIQYEVLLQNGQECGGAYLKLLSVDPATSDLRKLHDKTPYTIMFGPDKCGNDHKLHFIFRHVNPLNGTVSEKHCKKPRERLDEPFTDKAPHLYTLVLTPDNTFQISLDHKVVNEGSLLEDFSPEVNPPAEIDDPADAKPSDWDEREKIPDAEARKPDDWDEEAPQYVPDPAAAKPTGWLDDEPENVPDPTAQKPDDWDEEMDGEWEAPLVPNPACEEAPGCGDWKPEQIVNPEFKGKWRPPLIDNPNYQGKWSPRRVRNPHFFEDKHPFRMTSIFAVGFELWSMSNQILFDNLIVTDDPAVATRWAALTFDVKKKKMEKEADTLYVRVMRHINYKPGWWALYFVYCLIPISIYIWYLRKRALEDSVVSAVLKYTNENPWLWAVYVVVVGLPVVLIVFFCCTGPSASEKEENRRREEAKKTDEYAPDDEAEGEEGQDGERKESDKGKGEGDVEEETFEDDEEREDSVKGSQAKDGDDEDNEHAAGDAAAPPSPRKRRPRKD